MKIIIGEPIPFFSNGDEDSFFYWLKSIDAVQGFVGCPSGLEITLTDPVDEHSLRELIGLATRYGLDMRWLRQFRNDANKLWFDDETTYWHKSVFGSN
ncbi:hypothetical protein FM996_17245 [Methylosinus sporium]|uniref:Uncharacterized protein n=1 Tax=Methylosinus sporium TaxID=428 RepID=A0A549SL90_METSR|nr:hypothetical protein [Methylosinus sporium]TRL30317.1 hypothetical protein FM996_17245 [Methylosinus sporium]